MPSLERAECDGHVELLFAAWDKPCYERHKDSYWKTLARMQPIDLARAMEFCLSEEAPEKLPTAGELWRIAKRLRPQRELGALAPKPLPVLDEYDQRASDLLRNHIDFHVKLRPKRYGSCSWTPGVGLSIDQSMTERVGILVAAKTAWAATMRAEGGKRSAEGSLDLWRTRIEAAERTIDEFVAEETTQGVLL